VGKFKYKGLHDVINLCETPGGKRRRSDSPEESDGLVRGLKEAVAAKQPGPLYSNLFNSNNLVQAMQASSVVKAKPNGSSLGSVTGGKSSINACSANDGKLFSSPAFCRRTGKE
jgi:hypothetical protein